MSIRHCYLQSRTQNLKNIIILEYLTVHPMIFEWKNIVRIQNASYVFLIIGNFELKNGVGHYDNVDLR